ncbi:tryptophan halogenase family protein [Nocardia gamkensis]|uniref:Tryptophan 7-halogenase n=1 Tax=Nocardia gamkensis TaxID=352869 RepID=A0A7X6KZM5_9NOCA|nr:tryptophan halogenase family protein [Nocardia gamkensis]NKY24949.1 tryptophan 7-halogenase [Nocardia gamkensis]NQE66729.1 Flavin-dependent tryptophan halogenase RebH [Nocardia gamkensis]
MHDVQRVVIAGGGTAGWMTACYLKAAFSDRVHVTLVESEDVPTIGVGEATFSTIRHFFEYLGLEETEWMPPCHATYKLAGRFENWREPGHYFYHPFERLRVADGFPITEWWLHNKPGSRFDEDCFVVASLCDANRSPRYLDNLLFEQDFIEGGVERLYRTTLAEQNSQFPYAYHIDAALLARYLTQYGTARGVIHVLDDVVHVETDERGWIDWLVTRNNGELHGDLFIDCTGFRSLLLNSTLGEPFISYQDTLPNDSAVAFRVPVDARVRGIRPYTTATAHDAGWIWNIPLFDRIGTGYVYASDYCSPDQAEQSLRDFVGPDAEGLDANHIRMRIGRNRRSWVNNCVAVGLSSGFVEPLESTGIFFIHNAVEQLVKHFPATGFDERLRDSYNRQVAGVMDGVREFLVLHYHGAKRQDNEYWKDTKTRPIPDGLAERIATWQVRLPDTDSIFPYYHGFEAYSYTAMILGLGGIPVQASPALQLMDDTVAVQELRSISQQAEDLVAKLPTHYNYFAGLRGLPPQ